MSEKQPSRSSRLIAIMYRAALQALAAAPGGQLTSREVMQAVEASVPLGNDWARAVYPGTSDTRWHSIFSYASTGLVKGGYLTKQRGVWTITPEGRQVAAAPGDGLALFNEVKRRYAVWENAQLPPAPCADTGAHATRAQETNHANDAEDAPEVRMGAIERQANQNVAAELLERLKQVSPTFFEHVVVQLLVRMGYGGNHADAAKVTPPSADGGVDGMINEDPLGLDTVYLQAKRWADPVGEAPVRDFIGTLAIKGVKKGVLLTTSHFTPKALAALQDNKSDQKIVLVDGARLAALMIAHNLGVSPVRQFALKRVDSDFFDE